MHTNRLRKRKTRTGKWSQQVAEASLVLGAEFLTADVAVTKRMILIEILDAVLDDLFKARKKMKPTNMKAAQFYHAIAKLALAENAIMADAALDEIQGMLEEAEESVKRAEKTTRLAPP